MITPAYSPTATERVLPRLALDFTTGTLDPRVTVSRALNTATRVNSSGLVELVNANLPRFDYDPTTLAPKGLLIEESRQNLCLYSTQFNNSAWDVLGGALVVTPDTAVAPDGTTTADTITLSASFKVQAITVTSGAMYTFSVWMRSATASNYSVKLGEVNGSGSTVFTVTPTWQRFSLTFTKNAGVTAYTGIDQRSAASTSGSVYVWGAQLEAGAFATSYIPTTTTSLTRNADVVSMTGANFSSWYNATEGAIYAEGNTPDNVNYPGLVTIGRADFSSNYMSILNLPASTTLYAEGYVSGAAQFALSTTGTAKPAVNRSVLGYKANSFGLATNGGTIQSDTSGSIPTVDMLKIGRLNGDNNYLNGWVRKVMYWPQRITDAEIRAFSK